VIIADLSEPGRSTVSGVLTIPLFILMVHFQSRAEVADIPGPVRSASRYFMRFPCLKCSCLQGFNATDCRHILSFLFCFRFSFFFFFFFRAFLVVETNC
jgi:hypothetical protein